MQFRGYENSRRDAQARSKRVDINFLLRLSDEDVRT